MSALQICVECKRRRQRVDPDTGICIQCSRFIADHEEGRHNERRPMDGCPRCLALTLDYRSFGIYPEN